MVVFCLEHALELKGMKGEAWFNGWPTPDDPKFALIELDNAKYNSDLLPFGKDKHGMNLWIQNSVFFRGNPIAGFINHWPDLQYTIKRVEELDANERYVYPILVHGGGMLCYQSFREQGFTIHPRVLDDCRSGKAKILLHELNEGHGFNLRILKDFILNQAEKLNVPLSAFGFCDGNYMTPELQASYGTKGFCHFNWENHSPYMEDVDFQRRLGAIRSKRRAQFHFISLNRRVRQHRVPIVLNIMNRWKTKSLYSCDIILTDPEQAFVNPNSSPYGQYIRSGLLTPAINSQLPAIIDYTFDVNDTFMRPKLQEQAYISITSETMFFERFSQFFSEKVFKPILFMQPFILVGPYHSLHLLHEMGYKTFEPFIDESYDMEEDPDRRMAKILDEMDRLSKFTHQEMQQLVANLGNILIYNAKKIKERRDTHIKEHVLLQQIEDWVNEN